MKKFLLCLIIIVIATLKVNSQINQTAQKQLYLENYINAKQLLLSSVSNSTAKAEDLCALGKIYLRFNQLDSAKYFYDMAIKLNPNTAVAYPGLAKISILSNDLKNAEIYLSNIYKIDKNKTASLYIDAAEAYFLPKRKYFPEVMKYLDKAVSIDKSNADIFIAKGDYYLSCDSAGKATNEYERALIFDANNIKAATRIGNIFTLSKNFIEAQKAYLKALQIDSLYAPALRQLSDLYYSKGLYPNALLLYRNLMIVSEYDFNQQLRFATLLFQNKAYDEAIVECDKALGKDSASIIAKRIKSYTLFELKKYADGLALIQGVINRPDTENIILRDYEYYGKLLSQNDKDSLAIIYFFKVVETDTSQKELYEPIAKSFDKLKKYESAVKYYEKLIESKATPTATDYFMLARSCYNQGNLLSGTPDTVLRLSFYTKADTTLGIVISKSPQSYLGYFWRARVNSLLDPETSLGLAKPYYEMADSLMATNTVKYKKEIMESCQYLGYYYYLKAEKDKEDPKLAKEDFEISKKYWNRILELDPENAKAKEALKGIK